ncbi:MULTISPECIES: acetate kinase [unclassified Nocardioides]|uniref:acetate/propionate family kinase n=1 Tax=unclassified Nocardioides TaxID=2615069 RepID=UPI0000571D3A|nr:MULTISPECIES: acetate kinase [unclassified Nocardioides]ABL82455.1 acetate kinase [Nocardioides sp. JS614]
MSALVLVINAGSSSLKYSLIDAESGASHAVGLAERIADSSGAGGSLSHTGPDGVKHRSELPLPSHEAALRAALDAFAAHGPSLEDATITAVGHRMVHGGERFSEPALVDDALVDAVRELVPLAPLHNPANLEALGVARRLFDTLPHVAVFDTAFHQTLPEQAYTYAVPHEWREEHGIRRYGFHGTSHKFVSGETARLLGRPVEDTNTIVLHLGNGASATAVAGGRSVDTSMGLTPLEGLVMGTRSGDVDPALHAHLHRQLGWSLEEIDQRLNRNSGIKGLLGFSDFRELGRLLEEGEPRARLAMDVYCYRLRKYVGAYYAVLGRVDAIAFTGGVGEHVPDVRAQALAGLERLGIRIDAEANRGGHSGAFTVSAEDSEVAVLVVPTNEEWQIARESLDVVRGG